MFDLDLQRTVWGREIMLAAQQGPDAVVQVARRHRRGLDDEEADAIGLQLAALLEMRLDPPGRIGSIVAAAQVFAGPRTIARFGEVLRREPRGAAWKIERGLEVLQRNRGAEAAIQLLLCSRESHEVSLLVRARELYHGYPSAMRDLLACGGAQTPRDDLDRYLHFSLERAMLEGTRYAGGELAAALGTPAHGALSRVVWARYKGVRPTEVFVVDPDGDGFVDTEWNSVELSDDARVGVVHPAETTPAVRDAFGLMLAENEVVGLFPQFDRECVRAHTAFPYREIDRDVPHWDVTRFLYQHGWHRDRQSRQFTLKIRGGKLHLETRVTDADTRRLERISLVRPSYERLSTDDDIIFSEGIAATLAVLEQFAPDLI